MSQEQNPVLDAATIYENNIDSVVVVSTVDSEGSGVVVGNNLIATNAHVVDSGERIVIWPANAGQANMMEAKIIAASDRDLCLLETDGLSLPPVKIDAAKNLRVGHSVYAIGVPLGLGGTLSNGVVSRLWNPTDSAHALPGPLIQTNAAISPGSSGGGLFNTEGRLVGITTFSKANLNFSVPAEMIEQLHKRKEKELRQKVEKALVDVRDPDALIDLAWGIIRSINSRDTTYLMEYMGRIAAILGDEKLPQQISDVFRKIAESDNAQISKEGTLLNATVLSSMSAKHTDEAIRLIESLSDEPAVQSFGYATIAADCARHEGKHSSKAREVYSRIFKIPEDQLKAAFEIPGFISALAAAKVAMYDSEDALIFADRYINKSESTEHFLEFVGALGKIAATLEKQGVVIGAEAIFHYAKHVATTRRARGVGTPERLVALSTVAVQAAICGRNGTAQWLFEQMNSIAEKGSAHNLPKDRAPDIPYHRKIAARGFEATARAILGGWLETHRAFQIMKRIPVLDHLPIALVCIACKMRQNSKTDKD